MRDPKGITGAKFAPRRAKVTQHELDDGSIPKTKKEKNDRPTEGREKECRPGRRLSLLQWAYQVRSSNLPVWTTAPQRGRDLYLIYGFVAMNNIVINLSEWARYYHGCWLLELRV